MKAEVNTNPTNANVQPAEKRGFDMPLFELPKMAMPAVFRGIAEHGAVRVKENCEKMKAASGEMAGALRETYSTNAKGAADYGIKVIEISSVNTTFAFDFFTNLMGTKSLSEIMTLSTAQSRKNFEALRSGIMDFWHLILEFRPARGEAI